MKNCLSEIVLYVAAVFICLSGGACSRTSPVSGSEDAAKDTFAYNAVKRDTTTDKNEEPMQVKNDLDRLFLKGPVREMSVDEDNAESCGSFEVLKFGEKGTLYQLNGSIPEGRWKSYYKAGQIIKEINYDSSGMIEGVYTYKYDKYDNMAKVYKVTESTGVEEYDHTEYYDKWQRVIKTVQPIDDHTTVYKYTYDRSGFKHDSKGNYVNLFDVPCNREGVPLRYKVVKRDSRGNWVYAIAGEDKLIRKIVYWN